MSYTPVNVGTAANDGTGSPARDGMIAVNAMLQELYTLNGTATSSAASAQADADAANTAITGLRSSGYMHMTAAAPVAVAIATAGTFVGIGNTSAFASAELVDFTLVNDGTNQVLQYNGAETLTAAEIHVTVTAVASAGTKRIEVGFAQNGVTSTIRGPITHNSTETSVTHVAVVTLVPGDRIKPMITNNDDTVSINVHRVSMLVRR